MIAQHDGRLVFEETQGLSTSIPLHGRHEYIASMDIAKRHDESVLAIFRKRHIKFEDGRASSILSLHELHIHEGLDYVSLASRVRERLEGVDYSNNIDLIIDGDGVGEAVYDIMRQNEGLSPFKINATGGGAYHPIIEQTGDFKWIAGYTVPKKDLIDAQKVIMQQRRFHIPQEIPFQDRIEQQFKHYAATVTKAGNIIYGNDNESQFDDIVYAFSMASWFFMTVEGASKDFMFKAKPDLGAGSPSRSAAPETATYNPSDVI